MTTRRADNRAARDADRYRIRWSFLMGLIAAIAVFAILAWPFAVALLVVLVVVALTEKLSA